MSVMQKTPHGTDYTFKVNYLAISFNLQIIKTNMNCVRGEIYDHVIEQKME